MSSTERLANREVIIPTECSPQLDAAEAAKLELSESTSTQVEVPFLVGDHGLNVTLSRRKFEGLCRSLVLRLVAPMQEACTMAGIELDESRMGTLVRGELANAAPRVQQWQQQVAWRWRRMAQRTVPLSTRGDKRSSGAVAVPISRVLLVGGATRMPCIGRFIKQHVPDSCKTAEEKKQHIKVWAKDFKSILFKPRTFILTKDGKAGRDLWDLDVAFDMVNSFWVLEKITDAHPKCEELRTAGICYTCSCPSFLHYYCCKHVIAFGLFKKEIDLPRNMDASHVGKRKAPAGARPAKRSHCLLVDE